MLILDTPIRIGNFIYDRLKGGIQGTWDLRNRRVDTVISLARSQAGKTIVGTKENDGEQARIFPPPIVAPFGFQDSFPHDPAFARVFQLIHELNEALEFLEFANGFFTERLYIVGEEEVPLACSFVSSAVPAAFEEKQKKQKEEIVVPPPAEETDDKKQKVNL